MINMANPSHGAVGGSTDGSPDTGTADTDMGSTAAPAENTDAPAVDENAVTMRAEDVSAPTRDRKAKLGEVRQWTKPEYVEPDMSEWDDESKERWELQHPRGDRPVATGEILDDKTEYGYDKPMVDKVLGRDGAGKEIVVQVYDLEPPVDEFHQSPTPDRSQATGDGERLLAKFMGPEYQTRALWRDEIRQQIGADVTEDLVWSKANNHTVDITDVPQELKDYIIVGDGLMAVTRVAPRTTPTE